MEVRPSIAVSNVSNDSKCERQSTLQQAMFGSKKYMPNSEKALRITDRIAKFIVNDMRPYSLVESKEFRGILAECDTRYQVPSRKTFSEIVIPKMYNEAAATVKSSLSNAEMVALTTDGWSSRASESCMTITSSHITDDWKLENFVLQTRVLLESHTGDHVVKVLQDAVDEWKIPTQSIAPLNPPIVTDNASNMVKAGQSFNTKAHVMCYAHTLNLASQKCLKVKCIAHLLSRVRKTVSFFHRSNIASHQLKLKAEVLNLPQHKLIIDVCTRWNSGYDMLSRFLEMQVAVFAVLSSKEIGKDKETDMRSFSDDDLVLAEEVLLVLKSLKDITTMLCTEQTPTVSIIMPLQHKLVEQVFAPKDEDTPPVAEMKSIIQDSLRPHYEGKQQVLNMCTALDPSFKTLPYLSEQERSIVFNDLKTEPLRIQSVVKVKAEKADEEASNTQPDLPKLPELPTDLPDQPSQPEEEGPPTKKVKTEGDSSTLLGNIFGDVYICGAEPPKSPYALIEAQLTQYKDASSLGVDGGSPLLWWKVNEDKFPIVARLAKMFLCIPGTSVPAEHVFSSAGDIINAQRANLKSKHVDMLLFFKKNM